MPDAKLVVMPRYAISRATGPSSLATNCFIKDCEDAVNKAHLVDLTRKSFIEHVFLSD